MIFGNDNNKNDNKLKIRDANELERMLKNSAPKNIRVEALSESYQANSLLNPYLTLPRYEFAKKQEDYNSGIKNAHGGCGC